MKQLRTLPGRSAVPLALAAAAGGALPASTAAATKPHTGCVAPEVVGVDLSMARGALQASGCNVVVRQLPAHGDYVTPSSPDTRQLVGSQSPGAGSHASTVTISLRPLCAEPTLPGPETRGPSSSGGPTELIVGLFLEGGPVVTAPQCKRGVPSPGVVTVTTASGQPVAQRTVRGGRFGVFPLKPGHYLISGSFSSSSAAGALAGPQAVTISAHRTTRLNVVANT